MKYNIKNKLTENDLHKIVRHTFKQVLRESENDWVRKPQRESQTYSLDNAIDLLVDAYENISEATRNNKELRFDIAGSLNGIKNAVRIIRQQANGFQSHVVPNQM